MNTFGKALTLTTFGESHGKAMGGILDGMPPGVSVDMDIIRRDMERRRPGSSSLTTSRREPDEVEILSGISADGRTLGTPIGFIIRNHNQHSSDYDDYADKFRPNHADFTYQKKYGLREYRGGGRASARETVSWVAAASIVRQWLAQLGISVTAVLSAVGKVALPDPFATITHHPELPPRLDLDEETHNKMLEEIAAAKRNGDSVGGKAACLVTGLPVGLGEPMFDKLQSRLAAAMLSLNAVKGFEYGLGMRSAEAYGSETSDLFNPDAKKTGEPITLTNFSGGIQGGISNGMPVYFSVAFKPTPTLLRDIETVNTKWEPVVLKARGRHDPCVALRGVPVVEALAILTIGDMLKISTRIENSF